MQRDFGLGKRENKEQGWSRNDQRKQGGTWQLRGDASLKTMTATECRCNANDAMMNATNKQITELTRKTWKASGAPVLVRHNSPPHTRDLGPRSKDGTGEKPKRKRSNKVASLTNE